MAEYITLGVQFVGITVAQLVITLTAAKYVALYMAVVHVDVGLTGLVYVDLTKFSGR